MRKNFNRRLASFRSYKNWLMCFTMTRVIPTVTISELPKMAEGQEPKSREQVLGDIFKHVTTATRLALSPAVIPAHVCQDGIAIEVAETPGDTPWYSEAFATSKKEEDKPAGVTETPKDFHFTGADPSKLSYVDLLNVAEANKAIVDGLTTTLRMQQNIPNFKVRFLG